MAGRRGIFITLGGLATLSGLIAAVGYQVSGLANQIEDWIRYRLEKEDGPVLKFEETVTTQSDPQRKITVCTTCEDGETPEACLARHNHAVKLAMSQ